MAKKAKVWDGSAWQDLASATTDLTPYSTTAQMNTAIDSSKGLILINATTIGTAVSTVTVSNCFSATYDNYKIIVTGGVGSATNTFNFQLQGSTNGYSSWGFYQSNFSASAPGWNGYTNQSNYADGGGYSSNGIWANLELNGPYLSKYTTIISNYTSDILSVYGNGIHKVATSYTGFTINTAGGATITGGTVRVYGYKNS